MQNSADCMQMVGKISDKEGKLLIQDLRYLAEKLKEQGDPVLFSIL